MLLVLISGVYAEDISCDDSEIAVSDEVQMDISSDDIVSSNYLTDSEVSDSVQINDEYSDDEKISSNMDIDENSYDYPLSSDLECDVGNPTYEVGSSKDMSIDYTVSSYLDEDNQIVSPAVEVGNNSKFIAINYAVVGDFAGDGVIVPTVEVENCKFIVIDCSDSINQYIACMINSIDISDGLDISVSDENCIIPKNELRILNSFESVLADVSSDIEASENSNLGREVTTRENNLINFESVDVVLVITTEGVLILNIKTSEPAIENAVGYVGYISDKEVYLDSMYGNMSYSDVKEVYGVIGAESILFGSLIEGFNESISLYVLKEASFHRQTCEETNSGYTINKELLQYYPPAEESLINQTNKGNIIVMEMGSDLFGSDCEGKQYIGIGSSDFDGIDLCNPLWFNFILKQSDGSLMSICMRYNEDNIFIEDYNWTQTYNLMSTLYNSTLSSGISGSAYPDGIDKAIAISQWPNQESNYVTSESRGVALTQELNDFDETLNLENGILNASNIDLLSGLEDINIEDLLKSVATIIDNAKDNTKANKNAKLKVCKCPKCNHKKCNCLNCNCSGMNCSKLKNSTCHCNCSSNHHKHGGHCDYNPDYSYDYDYNKYFKYEYVEEVVGKISDSYGMLADNSTDDNATDKNVTATHQGPFNIPKPVKPTNFNTLIISLAGILVLGVLFGISHRRQNN